MFQADGLFLTSSAHTVVMERRAQGVVHLGRYMNRPGCGLDLLCSLWQGHTFSPVQHNLRHMTIVTAETGHNALVGSVLHLKKQDPKHRLLHARGGRLSGAGGLHVIYTEQHAVVYTESISGWVNYTGLGHQRSVFPSHLLVQFVLLCNSKMRLTFWLGDTSGCAARCPVFLVNWYNFLSSAPKRNFQAWCPGTVDIDSWWSTEGSVVRAQAFWLLSRQVQVHFSQHPHVKLGQSVHSRP